MAVVGDPVGSGIVKSLARPGGNITGTSLTLGDICPKQLEMLLSVMPKLSRVAVPFNPANFTQFPLLKSVQIAAQKTSVKILPAELRTPQEIEKAFAVMTREKAKAVIVLPDWIANDHPRQIVEHAAKNHLPSVASLREYVDAGGLMSYGQNYADNYRRAPTFVWTKSSRAHAPVSCRSSNPPNSKCSSTARPRRHWGSPSRSRF